MITREQYRDSVELQLSRYEEEINDLGEMVFNGWVRHEQVAQQIRFLNERARNCRYLLIVS